MASDDDDNEKLNRASSNGHLDSPRKVEHNFLWILPCCRICGKSLIECFQQILFYFIFLLSVSYYL